MVATNFSADFPRLVLCGLCYDNFLRLNHLSELKMECEKCYR
jgi:hypothetical protein